jgi:hypothetical protein
MLKALDESFICGNDVGEFAIREGHHRGDTTRSVGNIQACRVTGVKQI